MTKALIGNRSDYSFAESILRVSQLVDFAAENGYDTVELADTMTLSGVTEFINTCASKSIKPIIGTRLRVVPNPMLRTKSRADQEGTFYPKVYPLNEAGREQLFALLSKAYSPDYFYYVARVGYEDFKELGLSGNFIVRTGDVGSMTASLSFADAADLLLRNFAPDHIFVDVTPINTPYWDQANKRALEFANQYDLTCIESWLHLYASNDLAEARDVMAAILMNQTMDSPWRNIPHVRDFGLDAARDLREHSVQFCRRVEVPSAVCVNHNAFASRIPLTWGRLPVSLPRIGEGDEFQMLVEQCKAGWKNRLHRTVMGYKPDESLLPSYKERLQYELSVIKKMEFVRYFLVVGDLVKWAKMNHILVGPGRGSVGGSLVAYLIGITDVDPMRFGLLFERFINPERLDLPDADLDFQSDRRGEVIQYLIDKYGEDRVAGISNIVSLQSASALRDVGKAFGLSMFETSCSKFVPKEHGTSLPLPTAAEQAPAIDAFRLKHPTVWKNAVALEGTVRNFGRHAAGVIVAGEPIVKRAVVESHKKEDRAVNWDKVDVEHWGLVKIDVLGLSTLQVIDIALDKIERKTLSCPDLLSIPLDDPKVLTAFGQGKTTGVFQFESGGMKGLLKDLAFERMLEFNDLVAATALYRPGPKDSGLLEEYVAIKQGLRTPFYEHPAMERALKTTQGVMIYQEGVMSVFRELAGFTFAEADNARKAMGKKDKEKMEKLRAKFVSGAELHSGFPAARGEALFDKIMNFAAYGFNQSHAVEYSVVSYWAMWLKVYHPAEFFAATLTVLDEEKLESLTRDARAHGLEIYPPDINGSSMEFEVLDNRLLAPFHRLKGLSEATAEAILNARKDGPFKSYEDFEKRVPARKVNVRMKATLEKVGAFAALKSDPIGPRHPDRRKDQMELMPGLIIDTVRSERADIPVASIKDILVKEVLSPAMRGCDRCSLSGGVHPLPRLGKKAKFMVITDCPHWGEESAAKMLEGKPAEPVRNAMKLAGLSIGDGYFTSLVKSPKEGSLTNEQINGCLPWLQREIEILKPPVIVAMGGQVVRQLLPDVKPEEAIGRIIYNPKLDANIVVGFSPLRVHFDASKVEALEDVFRKVAELLE